MDNDGNYGLILQHLRQQAGLSVQKFAEKINRSVGWVSEVENNRGTSRLTEKEFDRIVELLDAGKHREMFRTWVANHKNAERVDRTFDGAVLKFIRLKKQMLLKDAASRARMSVGYLSKIESGLMPVTVHVRKQLMLAYGYSPSSFKNLSTDPVRSKAVPLAYKLEILLRHLSEYQTEKVFQYVKSLGADADQADAISSGCVNS